MIILECGETELSIGGAHPSNVQAGIEACCFNFDLRERWHPIPKPERKESEHSAGAALMPITDRRNVGVVRLQHLATGQIVWLCVAHLMTQSRDGPRTNMYPGEVRSGELSQIRRLLATQQNLKIDDAVLFVGDLNTAPSEHHVFEGAVPKQEACDDSGQLPSVIYHDTGLSPKSYRALHWLPQPGRPPLREAFEDVHWWADRQLSSRCTSSKCVLIKANKVFGTLALSDRVHNLNYPWCPIAAPSAMNGLTMSSIRLIGYV